MKLNEMTKKSFEDDETTSMHQTELQQGRYENWNEQGNQQVPIFKRIKKNLKRGDKGKRYKRLRKHIDRKRPWAPHNTWQLAVCLVACCSDWALRCWGRLLLPPPLVSNHLLIFNAHRELQQIQSPPNYAVLSTCVRHSLFWRPALSTWACFDTRSKFELNMPGKGHCAHTAKAAKVAFKGWCEERLGGEKKHVHCIAT